MSILITYSSLTGNTKKLAEGIFEHYKDIAVLHSVDDEINLDEFETVLHGFWVDRGGPDAKSKAFLSRLNNKNIGLFATLGAYPDSDHAKKSLNAGNACLDESNTLIAQFICQGAVSKAIKERMYQFPKEHSHYPDEARIRRWKDAENHPDDADIKAAIEVFKHVIA